MNDLLRRVPRDEIQRWQREAFDDATLDQTRTIVEAVREQGEPSLREYAQQFGDLAADAPLILDRSVLERSHGRVSEAVQQVLVRAAARIRRFAEMQRRALQPGSTPRRGEGTGFEWRPVVRVGCYAPGGRYPLPSTVLMTAVTARVAGVKEIWLATPNPNDITLAAAAIAGVDSVLAVGGAQAIAALAYGAGPVAPCDMIVGPGNRWVTAAKFLVSRHVGIDLLGGPSELVIAASAGTNPAMVAADLLAQAEHDPDAVVALVTESSDLIAAVEEELRHQLKTLPTAETARASLRRGFAVLVSHADETVQVCNALAPEHLQVHGRSLERDPDRFEHYGALFLGAAAAEVFGDYGAGPNHVLPTGGTARFTGGLSVFSFLRARTWLAQGADQEQLAKDAAVLARIEGLEGHARAAEVPRSSRTK